MSCCRSETANPKPPPNPCRCEAPVSILRSPRLSQERGALPLGHEVRIPAPQAGSRRVGALAELEDLLLRRGGRADVFVEERKLAQGGIPARLLRSDHLVLDTVRLRVCICEAGRLRKAPASRPEPGAHQLGVAAPPFDVSPPRPGHPGTAPHPGFATA